MTYVIDRVAIEFLKAVTRVAHGDETLRDDISQIKAITFVGEAPTIATNKFAQGLYH